MPVFEDGDTLSFDTHNVGHFGFTAVSLDDLEASGYTLAVIVCDRSGSTKGFQEPMEEALKSAIESLKPIGEEVLLRVLTIDGGCQEQHGFIPLSEINTARYDGVLAPQGATALYDGLIDGAQSIKEMGSQLIADRYNANGILIAITDGVTNAGRFSRPVSDVSEVHKAFHDKVGSDIKKSVESLSTILIGVNLDFCDQGYLWSFTEDGMPVKDVREALAFIHEKSGFSTDLIDLPDANPDTIAKIGDFISSSVSSTSTALGTGGPSQSLGW